MNDIKDLFGGLALDEPIKVEVKGKELELDMRVSDLHTFMTMGTDEQMTEDQAEAMTDILRKILKRSYLPHYDKTQDKVSEDLTSDQKAENEEAEKYIEGLLIRHYLDLFMGISEELGWQSKGKLEDRLDKAEKKGSRPK